MIKYVSCEFQTQGSVNVDVGLSSDVKLVNIHIFKVQIQSFFSPEIFEKCENQNIWEKKRNILRWS